MHTRRLLIPAAALTTALLTTGAAGGCGNRGSQPNGGQQTTQVAIKGAPSAKQCKVVLDVQPPTNKQLTATLTISCNFVVDTADISLVWQGRPAGSDNGSWENYDDPKRSNQVPPMTLTYTVICVPDVELQASANIDALADDGTPVNDQETSTPRTYTASECSGS